MKALYVLIFFLFINSVIYPIHIHKNETSTLINVYFKYNSTEYSYEFCGSKENFYEEEFKAMTKLLNNYPELLLVIKGFQNQKEKSAISIERCQKVKAHFVRLGINKSRLIIDKEYFITLPDTASEFDQLYSQRVEFIFDEKK